MGPKGLAGAEFRLFYASITSWLLSYMQYIVWVLGAIAAYKLLYANNLWLAIIVAILALSYAVHPSENAEHATKGMYSTATGTRLMLTFLGVAGILVYSFIA